MLYLTEPIDEVAIQNLAEYGDKKFVDVSREGIDLGTDDQDTKKVGKGVAFPAVSLPFGQPLHCLSSSLFCLSASPFVPFWDKEDPEAANSSTGWEDQSNVLMCTIRAGM